MAFQGVGDLAQTFQLRRDNARLQEQLRELSAELSTGRTSDLGRAVSGDFGALTDIERSLTALSAYETAAAETKLLVDASQTTLSFLGDRMSDVAPAFLLANGDFQPNLVDSAAITARAAFDDAVSALNTRVGDRSVFSGVATDGPALATSDVILDALEAATVGETTAAGVASIVSDWFASGGAYETVGYLGALDPLGAIPVSKDERVTVEVTALDTGIRTAIEALALGALLDRGTLSTDQSERAELARSAGERLLEADYSLTITRATVGVLQEQTENAETRNSNEAQALELARARILEVDPFEAATQLAAIEGQLETLYATTARLSRLSLTDFLR